MATYFDGVMDHKHVVSLMLRGLAGEMVQMSILHDNSKLRPEEAPLFEELTPLLGQVEYGSAEYKELLVRLGPALDHHYKHNTHHPEHFTNGVNGMTLLDLIEMVVDWIAASQRTKDGSAMKSLPINKERFHISDQLYEVIYNTVEMIELRNEIAS